MSRVLPLSEHAKNLDKPNDETGIKTSHEDTANAPSTAIDLQSSKETKTQDIPIVHVIDLTSDLDMNTESNDTDKSITKKNGKIKLHLLF